MKSSLKFTTIALLLGGVLNMPCLDAASAAAGAIEAPSHLEELQTSPKTFLAKFPHTDEGMLAFAKFADANPKLTKEVRTSLEREIFDDDSIPTAFLTGAYEKADRSGKLLLSLLVGVKKGSLYGLNNTEAFRERIAELETLRLALSTDLDLSRAALKLAVSALAEERGALKLTVSAPSAVVVTPEELPAFLVIDPSKRTPKNPDALAELVSVLAVRAALGTPDLPKVLSTLKTIETHLRHAVADADGDELAKTAVATAHSYATLRSQLLVMAPKIDDFLVSHTAALSDISRAATTTGWWAVVNFTPEQLLLNAEHRAGQNIAFGAYDGIFQTGTLASVVVPPQAVANKRSTNELFAALLALKPTQTEAVPVVVSGIEPTMRTFAATRIASVVPAVIQNDGLVLGIASSATVTPALVAIRKSTQEFLSGALGAAKVVGSTGLSGFETAELARASLVPVVASPPVVEVVVASGGSNVPVSTGDDGTLTASSSDDDEGPTVVPVAPVVPVLAASTTGEIAGDNAPSADTTAVSATTAVITSAVTTATE